MMMVRSDCGWVRFTALVFSCRTGAGRSAQLKRLAELVDRRVTVFHPEQTFEPPAARRRCAFMDNERVQEALFQIEGPDEDGCVWACSTEGRDVWCANLGPRDKVATVMSQWLASQDCDEGACERSEGGLAKRKTWIRSSSAAKAHLRSPRPMALEELYNYEDNSPFGYFDGDNLFTMQNEWIGFRRRDNVFDRHTNRFTHFRAGRFFYRVSDNQPVWFFAR